MPRTVDCMIGRSVVALNGSHADIKHGHSPQPHAHPHPHNTITISRWRTRPHAHLSIPAIKRSCPRLPCRCVTQTGQPGHEHADTRCARVDAAVAVLIGIPRHIQRTLLISRHQICVLAQVRLSVCLSMSVCKETDYQMTVETPHHVHVHVPITRTCVRTCPYAAHE